jgi:hypothetical protein
MSTSQPGFGKFQGGVKDSALLDMKRSESRIGEFVKVSAVQSLCFPKVHPFPPIKQQWWGIESGASAGEAAPLLLLNQASFSYLGNSGPRPVARRSERGEFREEG